MHSSWSSAKRGLPMPPVAAPIAGQWAARLAHPLPRMPTSPIVASLLPADWQPSDAAGPPPRPLASSWQNAAAEARSTASNPPHAALEMVDLEGAEDGAAWRMETEVVCQKGQPEVAASPWGPPQDTATLHRVFHQRCPDGHAPVATLPEIYAAAGLFVSPAEVEALLRQMVPEVTKAGVPYSQCQEMYLHLATQQHQASHAEAAPRAGCLARWMATDQDATNFLLMIVVTLCTLSAFLAAGVAILLLFLDGFDTMNSNLQEDLGVFQVNLEVYARQIAMQLDDNQTNTTITTLSTVIRYIGYVAAIELVASDLLKMATTIAETTSAWLNVGYSQSYTAFASLSAGLANMSLSQYGLNGTAAVFDELNAGLPADYEVLLARNASSAVQFLTQFRYAAKCPNGGCITNASVTGPMAKALAGQTFAQYTMDYLGDSAYAGLSSRSGLGVQVQAPWLTIASDRFAQVATIVQGWSANAANTYEYFIALVTAPGQGYLLAGPDDCGSVCEQFLMGAGMPLQRAALGQTGTMEFANHRGTKSLAAYIPVPGLGETLALMVQLPIFAVIDIINTASVAMLNSLNAQYADGSQEFEYSTFEGQGNTTNITHLTAYRYSSGCAFGQCVETPYVQQAAKDCSSGVMRTTDYRGVQVLVGYSCLSELNAVVSVKVDVAENEADTLQTFLEAVNARSAKDNTTSAKFLLATPKAGLTAQNVTTYADFEIRNKVKYPNACVNPNCSWNSVSALHAMEDLTDVVESRDYRSVDVRGAPVRSTALSYGFGLALETDSHELLQPMVDTAIQVGGFAIGMVVLSTVVLVLMTKRFLKSMIHAKEEGNRVVEVEKDRFSKLVSSMYPAYVVPLLLEGQKQMVCEVHGAAVFFSDIHEFTSASNSMGSEQLLALMAYVYGAMDRIADRFGVYKVKTIGDAYLAVLGLPGTTSANVSLDLLRFASCVCQVFGDRFVHPTEGQVLAAMNKAMQWNGRAAKKPRSVSTVARSPAPRPAGRAASGSPTPIPPPPPLPPATSRTSVRLSSQASASASVSSRGGPERVQCIMSYGLAVGKLVAGVLAGRCPMFDIWGSTVNLASRMQSTGEPGRIQVSEQVYRKVIAVPQQSFTFDAPRSVLCKGFGNVNAYMVRTTAEGLPKDLQEELRLEPRYGAFRFDNILATFSPGAAEATPSQG